MIELMRARIFSFLALQTLAVFAALPARAQMTDDQVPDLRRGRVNVSLESPVRADQVSAATANAVDKLYGNISDEKLTPALTVGEFLNITSGRDRMTQTLRRGEQIGGPRWLDGQTCQVKLAVPAEQVTRTLIDIAQASAPKSPVPPEAIAVKLKEWKGRTFIE